MAEPGTAVEVPGAAVAAAAVVDAAVKTTASPPASPAAAGVAVAVAEPGSYSAPTDFAVFWHLGAGSPT
jgi:hypothetical protein